MLYCCRMCSRMLTPVRCFLCLYGRSRSRYMVCPALWQVFQHPDRYTIFIGYISTLITLETAGFYCFIMRKGQLNTTLFTLWLLLCCILSALFLFGCIEFVTSKNYRLHIWREQKAVYVFLCACIQRGVGKE